MQRTSGIGQYRIDDEERGLYFRLVTTLMARDANKSWEVACQEACDMLLMGGESTTVPGDRLIGVQGKCRVGRAADGDGWILAIG